MYIVPTDLVLNQNDILEFENLIKSVVYTKEELKYLNFVAELERLCYKS